MNCRKLLALPMLMLSMMAMTANAQTLKNFLDSKDSSFTWLGVDFTQAKLIGDAAAKTDVVVEHDLTSLNQAIVNEQKKYDVPGTLHKDKYNTSIGLVNKRNESLNKDGLKSDDSVDFERLKADDIVKVAKSYDFSGKHGIGVLLVMEAMSRTNKNAAMWLTIVDMDKKHVLLTERYVGKAQKFTIGFRNLWLSTIKDVLGNIEDDYDKLKTKYADAKDPEEPKPVVAAPAPAAKKDTKAATTAPAAKKPKKKG
jgi:hypothetical protein